MVTRRNPRKTSTMNSNSSISSAMNTPNMPFLRSAVATLLAAGSLASHAQAATLAERENEFYQLVTVPIPEGIVLEAGAIQYFGKDRLAVTTRLGDIWFVDGALGADPKPANVKYTRYAQGLHEVLGITTRGDGWFYATQRGEITRIDRT